MLSGPPLFSSGSGRERSDPHVGPNPDPDVPLHPTPSVTYDNGWLDSGPVGVWGPKRG